MSNKSQWKAQLSPIPCDFTLSYMQRTLRMWDSFLYAAVDVESLQQICQWRNVTAKFEMEMRFRISQVYNELRICSKFEIFLASSYIQRLLIVSQWLTAFTFYIPTIFHILFWVSCPGQYHKIFSAILKVYHGLLSGKYWYLRNLAKFRKSIFGIYFGFWTTK